MSFNPRQDVGSPGLVYDKIYNSKADMDDAMGVGSDTPKDDGVFVGRYIFILYPRTIVNGEVVITIPDNEYENQYWDTAIFQKQYNNNNELIYQFITFLGFADQPLKENSLLFSNANRKLICKNKNELNDKWIELDNENLKLTHKLNNDATGSQQLTPSLETITQSSVYYPITLNQDSNPAKLGLYEEDSGIYTLTSDITVVQSKTYYIKESQTLKIPQITVDTTGHIIANQYINLGLAQLTSLMVENFDPIVGGNN